MPAYPLTDSWSDPISLQAGDIVQNHSPHPIDICPGEPDEANRLRLPGYAGAFQVDDAVTIVARSTFHGSSALTAADTMNRHSPPSPAGFFMEN